jgi:two-component system, cell cycle sensor histidine kinase and response regulator CckA
MLADEGALHGMVCDAARRILSAPLGEVRPEVDAALGELGSLLGASRAQLFLIEEDGLGHALAEWGDGRIEPDASSADDPNTVDPSRFPWITEHLRRLEPVEGAVLDLPGDAWLDQENLRERDTAWVLAVPVPREAALGGALILRAVEPRQPLAPEDVDLVELLADVLLHTLVRQRAERELHRARARGRALAEASFEALVVHNGRAILDCNQAACDLVGLDREQLIGQPVPGRLIVPEEAGGVIERIASGFEGSYGTTVLHRDGSGIPAEVGIRRIDVAGEPLRAVAVRDLRPKLQAEERLKEAGGRLRALLETAFEGVVVSRGGFVLEANEGFATMCGYEHHEVLGMMPSDVTTAEAARTIGANIRAEIHTPYVVEGVRKDGEIFPMEIQGSECYFGGERVRITGFRDLTEQRRLEAERRQLQHRVETAQRLEGLGILAGGIAHDFNNLLVGVLGNADLLDYGMAPDAPERERVREIRRAATRAAELVKRMLAYAGRGQLETRSVRLGEIVEDTIELLRPSLRDRRPVELSIDDDLPGVEADPAQLRQVIMNLITNATEATPGREPVIDVVVQANSAPLPGDAPLLPSGAGPWVELVVRDRGMGMDAATRARMFDPFFSTKFTGRGLGLAATLGIVRSHRGGLHVASQPGQGTTVRVLLPISALPPEALDDSLPAPTSQTRGGRVLVIDDEDPVRDVLQAALRQAGMVVDGATGGEDAVRIAQERGGVFDLVILDLTMPGMTGEEVFEELDRRWPGLPVLFTSGHEADGRVAELVAEGRAGFLAKPFRIAALMAKVRDALGAASATSA